MRGTDLSAGSFANASLLRVVAATIFFVKQELPFAETLDEVTVLATQTSPAATLGVFGEKSIINFDPPASAKPGVDYNISAVFEDSSPASIAIAVGSGVVHYAAYHPGLSYMQPAMPRRPVDRTAHLDGYTHFVPTEFDAGARDMLARAVAAAGGSGTAPRCSDPLVEVGHISSPAGTLLPLINWNTPGNQTSYWNSWGSPATLHTSQYQYAAYSSLSYAQLPVRSIESHVGTLEKRDSYPDCGS